MLRSIVRRTVSGISSGYCACSKHTLPDLPYDYDALEPYVSSEIMKIHHTKHHATYINNLNVLEDKFCEAIAKCDFGKANSLSPDIKFNLGGHLNHTIFWQNLSPYGGGEPSGDMMEAINRDFGSFENMKKLLSTASTTVKGSGWGWLGYNNNEKKLQIATCPNQDPLEYTTGLIPLFGIDVWEHAYYLQYKNVRPDYVNAIWNIANWEDIEARYEKATSS